MLVKSGGNPLMFRKSQRRHSLLRRRHSNVYLYVSGIVCYMRISHVGQCHKLSTAVCTSPRAAGGGRMHIFLEKITLRCNFAPDTARSAQYIARSTSNRTVYANVCGVRAFLSHVRMSETFAGFAHSGAMKRCTECSVRATRTQARCSLMSSVNWWRRQRRAARDAGLWYSVYICAVRKKYDTKKEREEFRTQRKAAAAREKVCTHTSEFN